MDTMNCTEENRNGFQLVYQYEKCELTVKFDELEFDDSDEQRKPEVRDQELLIALFDSSWEMFFDTVELMISDWTFVDCGLWMLSDGLI